MQLYVLSYFAHTSDVSEPDCLHQFSIKMWRISLFHDTLKIQEIEEKTLFQSKFSLTSEMEQRTHSVKPEAPAKKTLKA